MECLVLKCPKPKCGHTWLYTGASTFRVACPACNAYVLVEKNTVGAAEITYVVRLVDPAEVLKRMECEPKKGKRGKKRFANRITPELMKAVELVIKEKATASGT